MSVFDDGLPVVYVQTFGLSVHLRPPLKSESRTIIGIDEWNVVSGPRRCLRVSSRRVGAGEPIADTGPERCLEIAVDAETAATVMMSAVPVAGVVPERVQVEERCRQARPHRIRGSKPDRLHSIYSSFCPLS